jgi:regulator of RNase E activity RraA
MNDDILEALLEFSTPSISNGIESFKVRQRNEGFMDAGIRCVFPEVGRMVGYAATAKIRAAARGDRLPASDLWQHVQSMPGPRVVVVEDLDDPPGVGALWGEVNGNVHRALGCVGVVTNGSVRDLDEVEALGFHFFAGSVGVSHAYVHIVELGIPVNVGGLTVRPGDILHGDKHGVISVPAEIVEALPAAIRKIEAEERRTISFCQSPEFSADLLIAMGRGPDQKVQH